MIWRAICSVLLVVGALASAAWTTADDAGQESSEQSTYRLRSSVVGAAGGKMQAAGVRSKGTLAQPTPIGVGTESATTIYAGYWAIWSETVTGVVTEPAALTNRLFQNYPNPFNPTTTIKFASAQTGRVDISIYNVQGQRVRQLVSETRQPGIHTVTWDGRSDLGQQVASGVYFCRLQLQSFTQVKKMVILK